MKTVSKFTAVVDVRVSEARAGGLSVNILESGKTGFIPRREISWERRVSVPSVLPQAGDLVKAVILEQTENKITLSMRQVHDPWAVVVAERKYAYGQLVTGEVVNVRQFGAYIQLEPGVDAIVYPSEASFLAGQKIEDVLWVGDKIEAQIINLDLNKKSIEISLTQAQYSRAVSLTVEQQARMMLARFAVDTTLPPSINTGRRSLSLPSLPASRQGSLKHVLHKLSNILIIDDDEHWRDLLRDGLSRRFHATIEEAANKDEALGKLDKGTPYDLVLVDVNLEKDDGTELAQTIRQTNPNLPILLISSASLSSILTQYSSHLIEDEFLFAQKDNDTRMISEKLIAMSTGIAQTSQLSLAEENTWIQNLGLQAFSEQPISATFNEILKWLYSATQVSYCLIIRLDEVLREISITSAYPSLSDYDIQSAQDGLYFSPARQIMEESGVIWESGIDRSNDRFKNFFQDLEFQSYMGISIRTPDHQTANYGLVLLDVDPTSFTNGEPATKKRIELARLAAYFLAIILERAATFDYMRRYESQYMLGQLAGDLIHETSNKLNSLATLVKTFEAHWKEKPEAPNLQATPHWLEKMGKSIDSLSGLNEELQEIFTAYSQQTVSENDRVDVNQVVENVLRQLSRTARQKGMTLYHKRAKDMPDALGIQAGIKQVILNLVLNAIQMYDIHQKWMLRIGKQASRALPPPQAGLVLVQTKYLEDDPEFPLEIRVIDNGPGLHYRNRENIFLQGYSGRGGSGLGLYISRNLIQRMGGRLFLLDSVLFSGSAFAIRLPAANKEN